MFSDFFKMKHYYYIILIMKISYCELNSNVNQRFFTNTTAMNSFRFRDFEPRHALKTELFQSSANKRKPRGFQFNTDDRDFNVDLEFIVPFIRIPIERSMSSTQTAFRSLLNLDVQSIFTTAAIVAIGGVFAIVLKIIFTQYAFVSNYKKSFRSNDFKTQFLHPLYNRTYDSERPWEFILTFNKFLTTMETKFQENSINISHCIQSSLCTYARECFYNPNQTCSDGWPRILNGISSLHFVRNYFRGTSIKTALDTAKTGGNCSKVFSNCNLSFSPSLVLKILAQAIAVLNIT